MREISNMLTFTSWVDNITRVFRFDIDKEGNIDSWDCIEYDSYDDIPRIAAADVHLKIGDSITGYCQTALSIYAGGNIEYYGYSTQSEAYARLMVWFLKPQTNNPVYLLCHDDEFQKIVDTYPGREVYVYVTD